MKNIIIAILLFLMMTNVVALDLKKYPNIRQYIDQISNQSNLNKNKITELFEKINFNFNVVQKMEKMYELERLKDYSSTILTKERINQGVKFWRENQQALANAHAQYGVPSDIIVALIGIGTDYGTNPGQYPVFQSLVSLAFAKSNLSDMQKDYFKDELTNFLIITEKNNLDPLKIQGTYAGAHGLGNFMPNSYKRFAVDFDKSGNIDLNNSSDAIGSIAHYLSWRGWQKDGPIMTPAVIKGNKYKSLPINQFDFMTLEKIAKYGVTPKGSFPNNLEAVLVEVKHGNKVEYWLGFKNFHMLFQYNPLFNYTVAVAELAKAIDKAHKNTNSNGN